MSLPTLPASWMAPTSCFASTNYYYVLLGGGYFSNMYGTPTPVLTGNAPTGDCFPPSFIIDVPYLTDGNCPSGYTTACATAAAESSGQPVSSVTCCPRLVSHPMVNTKPKGLLLQVLLATSSLLCVKITNTVVMPQQHQV
jgi:hypothetical protein